MKLNFPLNAACALTLGALLAGGGGYSVSEQNRRGQVSSQPGADGAGNPFGGADGQNPNGNGQQGQPQGADNVTDVDYEEVGK